MPPSYPPIKTKNGKWGLVPLGKMCSPLYQETPCPSKTIQKTVISKEHLKLDPVPLFTDAENFQPYKKNACAHSDECRS